MFAPFDSAFNLRPYYWFVLALVALVLFVNFRLRDSRLGRAWIAIREDEVAAATMGVPLVKTKLLAYATGAAFGGMSGAFLGSYLAPVHADQFQFGFSIFVLAMIILGGLGSIWGVVLGAVLLSFINTYFIPEVFNSVPRKLGLDFDLTELNFGIFGFLILLVMVLRPQGLLPERRRAMELTEGIGAGDAIGVGARRRPSTWSVSHEHAGIAPATTGDAGAGRCSRPSRCRRSSAASSRSTTSRSRSPSARSSRSSAPTARARRRSSTCSPGSTSRRSGAIVFDGKDISRTRPDQITTLGHRAHVPEHPPVRDDERRRERDGRPARAHEAPG